MLNRNAEALFWVGRYMERAENHARMIDVHYHIQQEGDLELEVGKWSRLIDSLGARDDYERQFDTYCQQDVLSFITLDRGYSNSLFNCVSQARANFKSLREKSPSEMWDVLNDFFLWLGDKTVEHIQKECPQQFYKQIRERAGMFYGVQQSVMLREVEWDFLECGRYLERAENTVRILQSVLAAIDEDQVPPYLYLLAVLKSVSGYQAFRRYYADGVTIEHIIEFLISGTQFPRSVHFSFGKLEESLHSMDSVLRDSPGSHMAKDKRIMLAAKIHTDLYCLEREDLSMPQVLKLLEHLSQACLKLGQSIDSSFFRVEGATA